MKGGRGRVDEGEDGKPGQARWRVKVGYGYLGRKGRSLFLLYVFYHDLHERLLARYHLHSRQQFQPNIVFT